VEQKWLLKNANINLVHRGGIVQHIQIIRLCLATYCHIVSSTESIKICLNNNYLFVPFLTYNFNVYHNKHLESREKAYVNAITSAGVAYAITKACSRGELNECSCDNKIQRKQAKKNWQWGGCSEVIIPSFIMNNR
jgi:hypothetical protein